MTTPEQDALADIQGNVVAGFNKDHEVILLLQMTDPRAARKWLELMAEDVATSEEVMLFNDLFRLVRGRRHDGREVVEATWTRLLLTGAGLRLIGVPDDEIASLGQAFAGGMKSQAADLGDSAESDPSRWLEPYRSEEIHAAVVVASDDGDDMVIEARHILDEAERHGLRELRREQGHTLEGRLRGHEHFGFKDGISQPVIEGLGEPGAGDPSAVPLGEFVVGWSGGSGPDDPPAWSRNGSLVAFRRLRQDVAGFRAFVQGTAPGLGEDIGMLGAQLVGRWASGAPLALAPAADDPVLAADPTRNNSFDYSDDPEGFHTPRFAHIRKVFPRAQSPVPPAGESDRRRILRRGIPYGPPLPASPTPEQERQDRGLLFLCCQASIEEQFQFIQEKWANDPNFRRGRSPRSKGTRQSLASRRTAPIRSSGSTTARELTTCVATVNRTRRSHSGSSSSSRRAANTSSRQVSAGLECWPRGLPSQQLGCGRVRKRRKFFSCGLIGLEPRLSELLIVVRACW